MQNFSTYPLFYTHFHTKKLFIYFSLPLLFLCFSCLGYRLWEMRMWVWFDLVHKDCRFFVFLRSRSLLGLWFRSVFAKKNHFFYYKVYDLKLQNPPVWKEKEKKEEDHRTQREREKGQKLRLTSDRETQYVVLITKMPLKTELWKLKTLKMCFQIP